MSRSRITVPALGSRYRRASREDTRPHRTRFRHLPVGRQQFGSKGKQIRGWVDVSRRLPLRPLTSRAGGLAQQQPSCPPCLEFQNQSVGRGTLERKPRRNGASRHNGRLGYLPPRCVVLPQLPVFLAVERRMHYGVCLAMRQQPPIHFLGCSRLCRTE